MSNNPILSIIVPAYNAENTLHRCIDSLLDQNDASIEIIISNDGSTDKTWDIVKEYLNKDSRVVGISDTNGGVCKARNRAIKVVTGQWITFVDSDDYVAPGIFDSIIDVLLESNPDMLEYQFSISTSTGNHPVTPNQLPKDSLLGHDWISETIVPVALNINDKKEFFIENYACNKVYKSDIIRTYDVMFDETRRKWEDRLFSLTFLQHATTYYSMSEYGYYYVCGSSQTLSGRYDPDILKIVMDSYHKYRQMYGNVYCFDNAYTTNYFCDLLINVAKDQFAFQLAAAALKDMFSIFANDKTIQMLFSAYSLSDREKLQLRDTVLSKNIDDIYSAFERYASRLKHRNRKKYYVDRIRYLLSRVKRVLINGK